MPETTTSNACAQSSTSVAQQALEQLLKDAALSTDAAESITFTPGDIGYAARVRCAEVASAALAAGGVAASALWQLRTGRRQRVHVDMREAAASLTSFAHLHFADAARDPGMGDRAMPGTPGAPAANGFFPTADGRHIYLHPSFPPNHARVLEVLGVANDRAAVAAAVAQQNAQALQDRLRARGLTASVAWSPEEWDASAAGRELAARPVVEVLCIGESAPEPMSTDAAMPLARVRVLDLTRVLAGPACGRTLAHYGADVLHIANNGLPSVGRFVADTGHGKRNAHLDLKDPAQLHTLRELLRGADVFSQGYRGGALERLGLGVLDLARLRPGIIYTSINCYGHEGALRQQPGWEQLAQTATGLAWLHGGAGAPQLQPCALTDYSTGYLAAFGTMAALHKRACHGGSYLVRVSLSRTGMFARSLGLHPADAAERHRAFSAAEIASWREVSTGPYGALHHLRPTVQLSETPMRWQLPAAPLGSHAAAWAS